MKQEEIYEVLFEGFYEGVDCKTRKGRHEPVLYDKAANFRFMLGKIKQNVVMVDFDDSEAFEKRLQLVKESGDHCVVIKSAHKGGHFYWFNSNHAIKTNNNKNVTVLTFAPVDYKCGIKVIKSTGEIKDADLYGALCMDDGSPREIVYCNIHDDYTLDEIPFYDLPIKTDTHFMNMVDGDGRDQAVFDYGIAMKSSGFSYEQYVDAMQIVNTHLFKDALDQDQFLKVTRREKWDSINAAGAMFGSGASFKFNRFADYLIEKYHIVRINRQPHIYKDGVYVAGSMEIENIMIDEIPDIRKRQRNEVFDYIRLRCKDADSLPYLNKIAFKNGVYDILSDSLEPFNPAYIITNKIPWNYNEHAHSELIDRVLKEIACGNKSIRQMLEEVAGACLYRSSVIGGGKSVILKGEKSNGKSTFLDTIKYMLGESNYSVLDVSELGDRFSTFMLYGKLANIGDDISDRYREDVSLFKKIVTGNEIKAEEKGQDAFSFNPYCTLIFSANSVPRMNDPTGAAKKRMFIVPMKAVFAENDKHTDTTLINQIRDAAHPEHIEYFIQCAIDGLHDVLKNDNKYVVPDDVKHETDEWEIENNPMLSFLEDTDVESSIINQSTKDVYRIYTVFCQENNYRLLSQKQFTSRLCSTLDLELKYGKIKGATVRLYRYKNT